jgi:two-component system alkaline phosphatase synthesis response regulator PhoP
MTQVLLVEDDPSVRVAVRDALESEGYGVTVAVDGHEGLRAAAAAVRRGGLDLVVLDLMMPRMDGLEMCQRLRARGIEVPVIMLTARSSPADAAHGLKLGADDYVAKPFDVGEFLARVEAVLRRYRKHADVPLVRVGEVELDFRRLSATRGGRPVDVSPREFEILRVLLDHEGETVTREQLLLSLWGDHASLLTRTIDTHVARLRQKLEPEPSRPRHILTVHGVGYRLVAD